MLLRMPASDIALWVLSVGLMVVGVAGTVLPVIPGAALVLAGAVLGAWIDDFERVSGWTIGVLAALALLSWALDYVAGVLGAKKVGASKQALLGAAIGTVAGLFLGSSACSCCRSWAPPLASTWRGRPRRRRARRSRHGRRAHRRGGRQAGPCLRDDRHLRRRRALLTAAERRAARLADRRLRERRCQVGEPAAGQTRNGRIGIEMKRPVCPDSTLAMTERQGAEPDYCPDCRGVWLDRGELDKLVRLGATHVPAAAGTQSTARDHEGDAISKTRTSASTAVVIAAGPG